MKKEKKVYSKLNTDSETLAMGYCGFNTGVLREKDTADMLNLHQKFSSESFFGAAAWVIFTFLCSLQHSSAANLISAAA